MNLKFLKTYKELLTQRISLLKNNEECSELIKDLIVELNKIDALINKKLIRL